ncbi:MAG TPA: hypothetical protein VFO38_00770 [Candidatus Saccharimonadales bacterium]|nr:hypothetical protein [Candidatus Saccharimonadales bacterium]
MDFWTLLHATYPYLYGIVLTWAAAMFLTGYAFASTKLAWHGRVFFIGLSTAGMLWLILGATQMYYNNYRWAPEVCIAAWLLWGVWITVLVMRKRQPSAPEQPEA